MTNKELIVKFYDEIFNERNLSNLDQYMHPDYKQHGNTVSDGREGFRSFVKNFLALKPNMKIVHIVSENDLVVVYVKCALADGTVNKVFDMYRVRENQLVEHWDCVEHNIDVAAVITANGNGPF